MKASPSLLPQQKLGELNGCERGEIVINDRIHCIVWRKFQAKPVVVQSKFQVLCSVVKERHLVDDQPFLLGVHYYIRTLAQVLQLTALTVHTRRCVGTVGMNHGLDTSPTSMVLASPYVARSTVGAWFSTANACTAPTAPFAVTPAALGGACYVALLLALLVY